MLQDFTNARPNCSETVREAFRQMNEIVTSGSAGETTVMGDIFVEIISIVAH